MSIGNKVVTTGRGGAGNIGSPKLKPVDKTESFATPTLKKSIYTTGRGGSGNMAKNDMGAEARKAQDVDPIQRRDSGTGATVSTGRGGGGNMYRETKSEVSPQLKARDKPRQGSGVSEIARDVLRKIRSNSRSRKDTVDGGSARSSISSDRRNDSI